MDHAPRNRLLLLEVVFFLRRPDSLGHVLEVLEAAEGIGEGLGLEEVQGLLVHVVLAVDWAGSDHHLLGLEVLVALHELLEGVLHWVLVGVVVPWHLRVARVRWVPGRETWWEEHRGWRVHWVHLRVKRRLSFFFLWRELLHIFLSMWLLVRGIRIELRCTGLEMEIVFLFMRWTEVVKLRVRLCNRRVPVGEGI